MTTQNELLDTAIHNMGNRYLTTMLIAKRIRQLQHGAPTQVERQEGESYFSVAVREIAAGLITLGKTATEASDTGSNGTPHETPAGSDDTPHA